MALRFRKSVRILPGVWLNIGKRGTSISVGGRGARMTLGQRGTRATVGLPGTGLSFTEFYPNKSEIRPPKGFYVGIDQSKQAGRNMLKTLSQHASAVQKGEGVITREDGLAAIDAGQRVLTEALKMMAEVERTFKPRDAGIDGLKLAARNTLKALSQHAIVVRNGEAELSRDDSLVALKAGQGAITEALELVANVERITGRVAATREARNRRSDSSANPIAGTERGSAKLSLRWFGMRSPKSKVAILKQPSNSPAKPVPPTERGSGTRSLRRVGRRLAIASFILFGLAVVAQPEINQPLLGWMLIGLIVALIWAFTAKNEQRSADAAVDSSPDDEAAGHPDSDGQKSSPDGQAPVTWPWWV